MVPAGGKLEFICSSIHSFIHSAYHYFSDPSKYHGNNTDWRVKRASLQFAERLILGNSSRGICCVLLFKIALCHGCRHRAGIFLRFRLLAIFTRMHFIEVQVQELLSTGKENKEMVNCPRAAAAAANTEGKFSLCWCFCLSPSCLTAVLVMLCLSEVSWSLRKSVSSFSFYC